MDRIHHKDEEMIKKRGFSFVFISCIVVFLISGCFKSKELHNLEERKIVIQVNSGKILNLNINGLSSPLYLTIYQLKNIGQFDNVDFFYLKNTPEKALSESFISRHSYLIIPNELKNFSLTLNSNTTHLGFVAEYSVLDAGVWRTIQPVSKEINKINVNLNRYNMVIGASHE